MVYRNLSPPSILKNSGEAAKDRTARNSAPPWQCLFPHSQCNNCVSEETPVKLMTHPAYSPDLAPCDFSLFPNVKNCLRGHRFPSPEDAVAVYNEKLSAMSENEWRGCFQKWSEDAAVYMMCWRVLWKDVIGKETIIVHYCVSQNLSSYLSYCNIIFTTVRHNSSTNIEHERSIYNSLFTIVVFM